MSSALEQVVSRPAAPGALASLQHQDHACLIYDGAGAQLPVAAPFIKAGLDQGECCVYVVDDAPTAELDEALRAAGVDVDTELARGALVQLRGADFGPGQQEVDVWLRALAVTIAQAKEAGYAGLRIAVDMTWTLTTGFNLSLVHQFESLANDLFYRDRPVVGLCQYNRERFDAEVLAGALTSHPIAVVDGVLYQNLHYQPPDVLFGELTQRERVQWMLDELRRQRTEQEQREELIRAEAAARSRAELLATAAHELRTPVTSMRGFVQLAVRALAGDAPDLQQIREMMAIVDGQTQRLARLVTQLFEVSSLEAAARAELSPYDLPELVRQCVRACELASGRHTFSLDQPEHLVLPLDDVRFARVITNLLDNAVKYSPEGGAIEVELRPAAGGGVRLSVRDHGIGVPDASRARLFEPFYRGNTGDQAGMGLGLYLSREIVDQHGGKLTAEFPADGGTRFVVTLPG